MISAFNSAFFAVNILMGVIILYHSHVRFFEILNYQDESAAARFVLIVDESLNALPAAGIVVMYAAVLFAGDSLSAFVHSFFKPITFLFLLRLLVLQKRVQ